MLQPLNRNKAHGRKETGTHGLGVSGIQNGYVQTTWEPLGSQGGAQCITSILTPTEAAPPHTLALHPPEDPANNTPTNSR